MERIDWRRVELAGFLVGMIGGLILLAAAATNSTGKSEVAAGVALAGIGNIMMLVAEVEQHRRRR